METYKLELIIQQQLNNAGNTLDWTWFLPYFWLQEFIQQQTFKLMKKWKILLTQQIHSSSEESLNEKRHMVYIPFSLGSMCKYWIYFIANIGVFATLSNIQNRAFCESS